MDGKLTAEALKYLCKSAGRQARRDLEAVIETTLECESPIEQMMLAGLYTKLRYCDSCPFVLCEAKHFDTWKSNIKVGIVLAPQVSVRNYRVDFLLAVKDKKDCELLFAVECDGQEFHGSDEQKEKDRIRERELRENGVARIFRFSGREIWRDPFYCAVQVIHGIQEFARHHEGRAFFEAWVATPEGRRSREEYLAAVQAEHDAECPPHPCQN
jgi:very-short-patch-repair endonuclease